MLGKSFTPAQFLLTPTLILSRETLLLTNFAFYLLSNSIPFTYLGRKIGPLAVRKLLVEILGEEEDLKSLTLLTLVSRVWKWRRIWLGGWMGVPGDDGGVLESGNVEDTVDSFFIILTGSGLGPESPISDFVHHLSTRFLKPLLSSKQSDSFSSLVLSTMHGARGLERDSIYLLNEEDWEERFRTSGPSPNSQSNSESKSRKISSLLSSTPSSSSSNDLPILPRKWHFWTWKSTGILPPTWEIQQEKNLMYVAWTRACSSLFYIQWEALESKSDWQRRQLLKAVKGLDPTFSLPLSSLSPPPPCFSDTSSLTLRKPGLISSSHALTSHPIPSLTSMTPPLSLPFTRQDFQYLVSRRRCRETGDVIEVRRRPWRKGIVESWGVKEVGLDSILSNELSFDPFPSSHPTSPASVLPSTSMDSSSLSISSSSFSSPFDSRKESFTLKPENTTEVRFHHGSV